MSNSTLAENPGFVKSRWRKYLDWLHRLPHGSATGGEILVTSGGVSPVFQREAHMLIACGARREGLPFQQGSVVGLPVAAVLDLVNARNRNRLRWPVDMLSHKLSSGERKGL